MALQLAVKPQEKEIIIEQRQDLDTIIIGGGPAGLTAAIYCLRARLNVVLIEKMILGGVASTTYSIENYPGFPDAIGGLALTEKMSDQAKKLGLNVIWGNVIRAKKKKERCEVEIDGKTLSAKTLIIATGTEAAKLDIPGEAKFRGRGVSYCATCDGPFYKDKNIIVVGGGNAAVEEALFLTRYANKVSIVHRRDELRADRIVAERARNHPKIYFFWHAVMETIGGQAKVESVVIKDLLSGKKLTVPADGVFVYVGSRPNTECVKKVVKLDEPGYIITDEKMATSVSGIFAAGDVRVKHLRQVVTAAADGAIAADSIREYLSAKG